MSASQNKTVKDAVRRSWERIDIDTIEHCAVVIHTEPVCAQTSAKSLESAC